MSKAEEKVMKFYEKLDAVSAETGYEYEIKGAETFEEHIKSNTLFAGWFEPGTTVAIVDTGSGIVNFRIAGTLDATLHDKEGQPVHTFKGVFDPFENEECVITDDKDIEALTDGNHPSGYCLIFNQGNLVEVVIGDENVEPVLAGDPSVARCILDKEYVQELVKASEFENEIRKEALNDAMTQLDFAEMPDPPTPPEKDEGGEESEPSDIPHYSETAEGKAEEERLDAENEEDDKDEVGEEAFPAPVKEEVKKATKKQTKATASKTKKTEAKKASASKARQSNAKEANASEGAVGRFDLLPLDIISKMLSDEYDATGSKDILAYIEEYKKTNDEEALVSAAMYIAGGYFPTVTDFVFALAALAEEDPEAEMCADEIKCINMAIKEWLLYLKDGDEDGKLLRCAKYLIGAVEILNSKEKTDG